MGGSGRRADVGRHRRQGARALRRPRRVSAASGLRLFPYIVAKDVTDFRDGGISVQFEGISGRIDQAPASCSTSPNCLTIRANPLKTIGAVEVRKAALVSHLNSQHANRDASVHDLRCGSRAKVAGYLDAALPGACPAAAGLGDASAYGQGRQPCVFDTSP